MMIRMIESTKHNQQLTHDAFCRTITFTVFLENRDECVNFEGKLK